MKLVMQVITLLISAALFLFQQSNWFLQLTKNETYSFFKQSEQDCKAAAKER